MFRPSTMGAWARRSRHVASSSLLRHKANASPSFLAFQVPHSQTTVVRRCFSNAYYTNNNIVNDDRIQNGNSQCYKERVPVAARLDGKDRTRQLSFRNPLLFSSFSSCSTLDAVATTTTIRTFSSLPVLEDDDTATQQQQQQQQQSSRDQFSDATFHNCDYISPTSKRALTEILKFDAMTKVQEATLPAIMEGKDIVAKSKTGSGKSVAFLLPIIERLAQSNAAETSRAENDNDSNNNKSNHQIEAVILSPTRELAVQIATEFSKLATFHNGMKQQVLTLIGGTRVQVDRTRLQRQKNNIRVIIATPGRLQDHLNQNTENLVQRLSSVNTLVLDEADRLLDMGFRREIEQIISYMPQQQPKQKQQPLRSSQDGAWSDTTGRQTLLFSATFPSEIQSIAQLAMRPDYELIDTLDEDDDDTNVQVVQRSLVTPIDHYTIALENVLQDHVKQCIQQKQKFKIIVFFPTAMMAGFMAQLFRADPRLPHYTERNLLEMHSRKSQSSRTNTAHKFRTQANVIMFSSDVSARGVDYPNVTAVIQVGAPSEKAQYVHRLGRTARAGKSGEGVILLGDFERDFLEDLDDFDVEEISDLHFISKEKARKEQERLQHLLVSKPALQNGAVKAYQAFLGYYKSNMRRLGIANATQLVTAANKYATAIGFPEGHPPALNSGTVGKMGLSGVRGLNVEKGRRSDSGRHSGRGGDKGGRNSHGRDDNSRRGGGGGFRGRSEHPRGRSEHPHGRSEHGRRGGGGGPRRHYSD